MKAVRKLLARRREVWRMRVHEHKTQVAIADDLGITRRQVEKDLKWMAAIIVDDLKAEVRQTKIEQVSELRHIVSEAMTQWEASKGTKKVVTRHTTEPAKQKVYNPETGQTEEIETGNTQIVTIQHVTQLLGSIKFLTEAREAMADIRKILGADAPLLTAALHGFSDLPQITIREVVVEIPATVDAEIIEEGGDG